LSSEDELIRRAQAGETDAFCLLAQQLLCLGWVLRIASRIFGPEISSVDSMQGVGSKPLIWIDFINERFANSDYLPAGDLPKLISRPTTDPFFVACFRWLASDEIRGSITT